MRVPFDVVVHEEGNGQFVDCLDQSHDGHER